jgi:O-antigen ligase
MATPTMSWAERAPCDRAAPTAGGANTDEEWPVRIVAAFAIALFVFPSNSVVKAVGANGYVASLVGLAALGVWVGAVGFGRHNPLERRSPLRIGVALLWIASLISYGLMSLSRQTDRVQLAGDRWLLQLAMVTGVAFVASEGIRTLDGLRRVVRAVVLGASVCSIVGLLQFTLRLDLTAYLRMLPGFELNLQAPNLEVRYGLTRVFGTAIHPIEFGVANAMVLPLALWQARFASGSRQWRRWAPPLLISGGAVVSVSRSAVVGLVIALAVLLTLIPAKDRALGFLILPVGLIAVFLAVPGYYRTMSDFFLAGGTGTDPSVSARTDDYSLVTEQLAGSVVFGQGPGRFIPGNALEILDNQYLATAIDLGLVGLTCLLVFLVLPMTMALSVRRRTHDPQVRWLCASLAGSALASVVCTFTFDSFSFPMFVGAQALIAGLAGACWSQHPITPRREQPS